MPAHLSQVLAQHEFQEAFKNYRDLRYLAKNLDDWKSRLGIFDDMLATRRKAFADKLPPVQARAGDTAIELLAKRREAIADEIANGEQAGDGVAFADAKELDLRARVKTLQGAARRSPAPRRTSSPCATGCGSPAGCCPGSWPRSRPTAPGPCRRSCGASTPNWSRSGGAMPSWSRRRRKSRPASTASARGSRR